MTLERERKATVLDLDQLRELVGDDEDVISEIVDEFAAGLRRAPAEFKLAKVDGGAEAVQRKAHTLKSACRSVGAERLGALCEAIEQAEDTSEGSLFEDLWAGLDAEIDAVIAALRALGYRAG